MLAVNGHSGNVAPVFADAQWNGHTVKHFKEGCGPDAFKGLFESVAIIVALVSAVIAGLAAGLVTGSVQLGLQVAGITGGSLALGVALLIGDCRLHRY